MLRQYVASAYIVKDDKVLLLHHRKLDKWLPAGGHLLEGELPHEGARREALEETGLEVAFWQQENVWVSEDNAASIPRPFLMLLEEIPAYGTTPAHQHIDFVYVATPLAGRLIGNGEAHALRWFTRGEVDALAIGRELFRETALVLQRLFALSPPVLLHS